MSKQSNTKSKTADQPKKTGSAAEDSTTTFSKEVSGSIGWDWSSWGTEDSNSDKNTQAYTWK